MNIVYLDRSDVFKKILKIDGTAEDLSSVSAILLVIGSTVIESENDATDPITWAKAGYDTGEVRFCLGGQTISEGQYNCPLIVKDSSYPNGRIWDYVPITVVQLPDDPA